MLARPVRRLEKSRLRGSLIDVLATMSTVRGTSLEETLSCTFMVFWHFAKSIYHTNFRDVIIINTATALKCNQISLAHARSIQGALLV